MPGGAVAGYPGGHAASTAGEHAASIAGEQKVPFGANICQVEPWNSPLLLGAFQGSISRPEKLALRESWALHALISLHKNHSYIPIAIKQHALRELYIAIALCGGIACLHAALYCPAC